MADPSLRDRALAEIDDTIVAIVGKEIENAWGKRAGGQPEDSVVKQFADGLPKLFALHARLRATFSTAAAPPRGALS